MIKTLIDWVRANPEGASAVAVFVLTLLNGVLRGRAGWSGDMASKLHLILDYLSPIARRGMRGQRGKLKLPGTKSR